MNISNCLKLAEIFLVYVSFTFFASLSQAAVHTHFDAEKSKPGVFLYRDYRSNSNACQDWVSMSGLTCGASPGGYYDATLDGFVIPIVEGVDEANSLRALFNPVGGEVWTQWEIWIDQDFVDDLPIRADDGVSWENTKLFRFHNYNYSGCDYDHMDTLFITYKADSGRKYLLWEDTNNKCGGTIIDQGDFGNDGNKWWRYTFYQNFTTKNVKIWVTDPLTGVTTLKADETRPGWTNTALDGVGPLLHSSKRSHHPDTDHPTYTFAYRNMIVSTQPIAFTTGTPPPPPIIPGDVNDDGEVNTLDIQACVNHILGITDYGEAADVNESGQVDVVDIQEISNIIME